MSPNELTRRCSQSGRIAIGGWIEGFRPNLVKALETWAEANPDKRVTKLEVDCAAENIMERMVLYSKGEDV